MLCEVGVNVGGWMLEAFVELLQMLDWERGKPLQVDEFRG